MPHLRWPLGQVLVRRPFAADYSKLEASEGRWRIPVRQIPPETCGRIPAPQLLRPMVGLIGIATFNHFDNFNVIDNRSNAIACGRWQGKMSCAVKSWDQTRPRPEGAADRLLGGMCRMIETGQAFDPDRR